MRISLPLLDTSMGLVHKPIIPVGSLVNYPQALILNPVSEALMIDHVLLMGQFPKWIWVLFSNCGYYNYFGYAGTSQLDF